MRVCTKETIKAFENGTQKSISVRDSVTVCGNTVHFKLWGHSIAIKDRKENTLTLSDCGYSTVTTAERLSAILNFYNVKHAGKTVYYSTSCGFHTIYERPNKRDASKTVWDREVINPSKIVVDCNTWEVITE